MIFVGEKVAYLFFCNEGAFLGPRLMWKYVNSGGLEIVAYAVKCAAI